MRAIFTFASLICVFGFAAQAADAQLLRSARTPDEPETRLRNTFAPNHPGTYLYAALTGAAAPTNVAGRGWMFDLHYEPESNAMFGLRGAVGLCDNCNLGGALVHLYAGHSRRNFAIGASVDLVYGKSGLLSENNSEVEHEFGFGLGAWVRVGRLEGIRLELPTTGLVTEERNIGLALHADLRVPLFANDRVRLYVQTRVESGLNPWFLMGAVGVLLNVDHLVVGAHFPAFTIGNKERYPVSLMLTLGFLRRTHAI